LTDKLAMLGGKMALSRPLAKYNPIGGNEIEYVTSIIKNQPLSGYLGGRLRGGAAVQRLEELWAVKFGVRHAIACNSATSGLMAAANAAELFAGTKFVTTPFTMSATAAAPMFQGALPIFGDIEGLRLGLSPESVDDLITDHADVKAVVVTNLFGAPAHLAALRGVCDRHKVLLIEDNAQSILATEGGQYAGTIGDIGVFSLNVHKHIQCGEGGIIVTNNGHLAACMRKFINHSELFNEHIGLNLRMPEVCAAIALAQLERVEELVEGRRVQAKRFSELFVFDELDLSRLVQRMGSIEHSFYVVPFILHHSVRDIIFAALTAEGLPMVKGYVTPLNQMPAFAKGIDGQLRHMAKHLHEETLIYFSNCEWDIAEDQYDEVAHAIAKVRYSLGQGDLQGSRS
jgi:perosamine synthetase